jgi:hypothetical protein
MSFTKQACRPFLTALALFASLTTQPVLASDAIAVPAPIPSPAPGTWAWSLLVPGLGQILLGDPDRGGVILGSTYGVPLVLVGASIVAMTLRPVCALVPPRPGTLDPCTVQSRMYEAIASSVLIGGLVAGFVLWFVQADDAFRQERLLRRKAEGRKPGLNASQRATWVDGTP